jgi:Bacterial Ig-like domain (group 2)
MIRGIVVGCLAGAALAACGNDSAGPDPLTPVASIAITPIADTLLTGQRLKLEVRAYDSEGAPLPDRPMVWESAEPAIASVTAGGVLTVSAPGITTIRAMVQDVIDSVRRRVPFVRPGALGRGMVLGKHRVQRVRKWFARQYPP